MVGKEGEREGGRRGGGRRGEEGGTTPCSFFFRFFKLVRR